MDYDCKSDMPLLIYFPYSLKVYIRSLDIETRLRPYLSEKDKRRSLQEHEVFSKLFNLVAEKRRLELKDKKRSMSFRVMNTLSRPFSIAHDFQKAHSICPKEFKKKFYIFQSCRLKHHEWDILYLIIKEAEKCEIGEKPKFFGARYNL